jgi:hypothetical protein
MKSLFVSIASLFLLGSSPAVFAGVPSLVGTWDIKAEGAIMLHGSSSPGKYTHWSKGQTTLTGTAEVLSQDGRTIKGVFKLSKTPEPFIAVIGRDGNLHLVDDDGFADYRIVNNGRLEGVYRHVTAADSVICNSVWTREK